MLLKHGTGKYDTKHAIDPQPSGMAAEPLAGFCRVCKMHELPMLSNPVLYVRFLFQETVKAGSVWIVIDCNPRFRGDVGNEGQQEMCKERGVETKQVKQQLGRCWTVRKGLIYLIFH